MRKHYHSRSVIGSFAVLAVVAGLACVEGQDEPAEPTRSFDAGVFTSTELPAISIRLPEEYIYAGQTAFVLGDEEAEVDRHHFLTVDQRGSMDRLVVLHFETIMPGNDMTFNYGIPAPAGRAGPDYRFSPAPVRLGEHEYIHNTWFFDATANIRENPDRELARTAELLADRGYQLPPGLQMSRYVRVVDQDGKSELILFYFESLSPTGFDAGDFVETGAGAAVFDSLSAELTMRSEATFVVERG